MEYHQWRRQPVFNEEPAWTPKEKMTCGICQVSDGVITKESNKVLKETETTTKRKLPTKDNSIGIGVVVGRNGR